MKHNAHTHGIVQSSATFFVLSPNHHPPKVITFDYDFSSLLYNISLSLCLPPFTPLLLGIEHRSS
jgi:hypothetical protein